MPTKRLAVGAALATATALSASLLVSPAEAGNPQLPRVRIKASDYRVSSGEQFIIKGRLTLGRGVDKMPAPRSIVRAQTKRGGKWRRLSGAQVKSKKNGRYRIRIILGMPGKRKLRVHTKTPTFRKWVNSRRIKVRVS